MCFISTKMHHQPLYINALRDELPVKGPIHTCSSFTNTSKEMSDNQLRVELAVEAIRLSSLADMNTSWRLGTLYRVASSRSSTPARVHWSALACKARHTIGPQTNACFWMQRGQLRYLNICIHLMHIRAPSAMCVA